MIEKGANLVICQHSHCIGCEEKYLGGTIVYGQGIFIFDYGNDEYWQTSLLVHIDDFNSVDYIPIKKEGIAVRLNTKTEAKEILEGFERRRNETLRPGFIENKYKRFAEKNRNGYIIQLMGKKSLVFRALNKLTGYRLQDRIAIRYINQCGLGIRNYIEYEAHRELLIDGLKQGGNSWTNLLS